MDSVCFATRMRLDLPERLPSLSEYLCGDEFPSPQVREDDDDDDNLMVHLQPRGHPTQTDCFLSDYGSRLESPENIYDEQRQGDDDVKTWTWLDTKPPAAMIDNHFRSGPEVVTGSYDRRSKVDPLACYLTAMTSSSSLLLPRFPVVGDVMTSSSHVSVTWTKPEVAEMSPPCSPCSSRKRVHHHHHRRGAVAGGEDDPEARKLELKRAKNREAAQRCQQRKQERIVRLEGKVGRLREQNDALSHTVAGLREQVTWLRRQVANHVHNGCHIALPTFNAV